LIGAGNRVANGHNTIFLEIQVIILLKLVYPALYKLFYLLLLEAMACGLSVVPSNLYNEDVYDFQKKPNTCYRYSLFRHDLGWPNAGL